MVVVVVVVAKDVLLVERLLVQMSIIGGDAFVKSRVVGHEICDAQILIHSRSYPVFESLLKRLAHALEVTQNSDSTLNPQTRQAIFQATTSLNDGLARAKDIANTLPGGEMLIEEQNDVIAMLERLRDLKQAQLAQFSERVLATAGASAEQQARIEVDSTASSPHD
ncbi:hypothetical protein EW145_g4702 [Phellinidium pouzarii]|uniref:Mediator of RNA polymerase II transcription subunit 9 n=1 Tax=Phellinidium pouzarii TaxID=167371 RepID=A0A4S4L3X2_9AGAM|nr:hypothetical protein EW145_g4702 [Phellinidium pouzarii]